ncbi:hypothetical protein CUJ83_15005 [Methanocella sp. CWC-04]|uniref:LURP-one-related n=2 Tax=Methanooceanicella nereidis TaxID=2052831 RepID=A0AAP2W643_9EURY|nr:hypothetical protein [Methanocella sp. CWC-04]
MDKFSADRYIMEQKMLSIGKKYYIKDQHGNNLFFARMEKFKLKPKIFVYNDDSRTEEILAIAPRNIIDFNATYDVIDSRTGERVGSFRRDGVRSLFQNKWNIMDANGNIIGSAQETGIMALVRRFIVNWKLDFELYLNGRRIGSLTRRVSIGDKYTVDVSGDGEKILDRRLAVAMLPLLDAGEDR